MCWESSLSILHGKGKCVDLWSLCTASPAADHQSASSARHILLLEHISAFSGDHLECSLAETRLRPLDPPRACIVPWKGLKRSVVARCDRVLGVLHID